MASAIETLAIKLVGDIADFESKINTADGKIDSFSSKMQQAGSKMAGFGVGLTAGVTAPIVGMALKSVDAASDLNESMSKVDVVFGDSAASVQKWAEGSAKAFGQSKQQTLEAVGTYGNLFTAMGIGVDKSADMSQSLVVLASDLASFNNIDPTEALEKLRAGLVGETEPLRSLGVNLSAAAVEAKAMQMGLVSTSVDMGKLQIATDKVALAQQKAADALAKHGAESTQYKSAAIAVQTAQRGVEKAMEGSKVELDAATKAQAAYALILEQTKTAQGDFERTSGGLANMTRIVKAQFEDLAAQLGQQLLPIAIKIVEWISNLLAKFQGLSPETQKWILIIAGIAAAIGPVLVVLGTLISSIGAIAGALAAMNPIVLAIVGVVAALAIAWTTNFAGIRDAVSSVFGVLQDLGRYIMAVVEDGDYLNDWLSHIPSFLQPVALAFGTIISVLRDVATEIGAWLAGNQTAFETAKNIWNSASQAASVLFERIISVVSTNLPIWLAKLTQWSQAAWEWVVKATPIALAKITEWGVALVSWIGRKLPDLIATLLRWATELVKWIADAIPKAITQLGKFITAIVDWIGGSGKTSIVNSMPKWVSALLDWITKDLIPKVVPELGKLGVAIVQGLGAIVLALGDAALKIGAAIISGIVNGIVAGATAIADAAKNAASSALNAAKEFLGISSPSKRAMEEIGLPFAEGIGAGISAGQSGVVDAATRLSNTAMEEMGRLMGMSMPGISQIAPNTLVASWNAQSDSVRLAAMDNLSKPALAALKQDFTVFEDGSIVPKNIQKVWNEWERPLVDAAYDLVRPGLDEMARSMNLSMPEISQMAPKSLISSWNAQSDSVRLAALDRLSKPALAALRQDFIVFEDGSIVPRKVREAFEAGTAPAVGAATNLSQSAVNAVSSGLNAGSGNSLGGNFAGGIAAGIQGGTGAVVAAAQAAANQAMSAATVALRVSSPSKRTRDEIGVPFAQGIGVGIMDGMRTVAANVRQGIDGLMQTVTPAPSLSAAGAGGASGGNNVTINVPVTFLGNPDRREVAAGINSGIDDVLDGLRRVGLR